MEKQWWQVGRGLTGGMGQLWDCGELGSVFCCPWAPLSWLLLLWPGWCLFGGAETFGLLGWSWAPSSEQGRPHSGAAARGSCGAPWGPGHSLAELARGHRGVQPCPCLLFLPAAAPGGCSFHVLAAPVVSQPSTASARPASGGGRRKGSLFPLC